jgi:hypothetical protein
MDGEEKRCEHGKLVKIEVAGSAIPMFGNVYQCEFCKALVELVIGRTITTQQLREFADAIESGKAKPSIPPPMDRDDSSDLVEVDDDNTWGGTDGSG